MKVQEAIDNYLYHITAIETKSDRTVSSYRNDLSRYSTFLNENSIENIEDVRNSDLQIFLGEQLDQLTETGLLSGSVGMLTDSRSFTSFARHEYFRRILCEKLGGLVERGEYPCDWKILGELVEDVCWRNAVKYFGFEV